MMKALSLIPFALLVTAAGCGSTGGGGGGGAGLTTPGVHGNTVNIVERDFSLNPSNITLPNTGTYVFKGTNKGAQHHALEIEGHGVEAKAKAVSSGNTTMLTVNLSKPGKYEIYCPVDGHKGLGMTGTVTVGSGGGGSGGGTGTSTGSSGY